MPFKGEVEISSPDMGQLNQEKFNVLDCSYRFTTPSDGYGRITGRRVVGKINFVIETTPKIVQLSSIFFLHSVINGKFTFYQRDQITKMLEVEFNNGRLIELDTIFATNGSFPMTNRLTISTEKITLTSGGETVEDTNDWGLTSEY